MTSERGTLVNVYVVRSPFVGTKPFFSDGLNPIGDAQDNIHNAIFFIDEIRINPVMFI